MYSSCNNPWLEILRSATNDEIVSLLISQLYDNLSNGMKYAFGQPHAIFSQK